MKHLFIINPKAGKHNDPDILAQKIHNAMEPLGEEYYIKLTEYPGHATVLAAESVSDGADWRVYACGGDGTLEETLNGVAGRKNVALTVYPCGTGNDFARFFGNNDALTDISLLANSKEREIDLIDVNGHYSINICSVGFDAKVAAEVHRFSKLPGMTPFGAFTMSALCTLIKGIADDYDVIIDGQKISGRYTLICVANAKYYGGGYMPMGDADPTDGILDVLVIDGISRFRVPALLSRYKSGNYLQLGNLAHRYAAREVIVEMKGKEGFINADGEIIHSKRAEIRLSKHRIRFFAPDCCLEKLPAPQYQIKNIL